MNIAALIMLGQITVTLPGPGPVGGTIIGACSSVGYPASLIATNLSRHFSADCITFSGGVCSTPADGTSVTTWDDSSGNGATATLQTGTATFHTNQLNGLPTVTLSNAGFTFTRELNPNIKLSAFAVFLGTGMTGGNANFVIGAPHGSWGWSIRNLHSTLESIGDCVDSSGSSTFANSTWYLTSATSDTNLTNAVVYRRNIASDGTSTACENPNGAFGAIGYQTQTPGEFLNGQIADLATYTDVKNATDTLKNECSLFGKWRPF